MIPVEVKRRFEIVIVLTVVAAASTIAAALISQGDGRKHDTGASACQAAVMDPKDLKRLAASLDKADVVQPLTIRLNSDGKFSCSRPAKSTFGPRPHLLR